MKWTDLLKACAEQNYNTTEKLLDLVDDSALDWKPESGDNWMTTGQLIHHLGGACGAAIKGFVTGDWGMPEGVDLADLSMEEMLPPAEGMEASSSVAAAKAALAEDKILAMAMIDEAGEERLETQATPAPWDPTEMPLGMRALQMVNHLDEHTGQLFYYLKLQGKPVNTLHRYGMG